MADLVKTRLRSGQPSATAEINAQMRAADAALRPHRRLVDDPYARHFVTNPRYRLLRLTPGVALAGLRVFDRLLGGMLAEILLRGRYFEEALDDAVSRGVRQVVLLGAGYDATALRHPELATVRFFEADHLATQRVKRHILARLGATPTNVTFVPVDFEHDLLASCLEEVDFDVTAPCLVAWLGVSYYLTAESFQRALNGIADICAPGSTLLFDYMDPSVMDGTTTYPGARRAARSVRRRGEPYTLGLSPRAAAEAASAAGFRPVESVRVPDLVRRYGGERPYCRPDDYMGVVTVTRAAGG
jgi:methyltransferase (TIGR00027 family)